MAARSRNHSDSGFDAAGLSMKQIGLHAIQESSKALPALFATVKCRGTGGAPRGPHQVYHGEASVLPRQPSPNGPA